MFLFFFIYLLSIKKVKNAFQNHHKKYLKSAFNSDFRKRFYPLKHLNDKKIQVLKILETFYKITINQTLNLL